MTRKVFSTATRAVASLACCLLCCLMFASISTSRKSCDLAALNSDDLSAISTEGAEISGDNQSGRHSSNCSRAATGLSEFNQRIFQLEHFDRMERFFFSFETFQGQKTVSDLMHDALVTKVHTVVYGDIFSQHYDNFADLRASGGPQVNQKLCLSQLEQLVIRANKLAIERGSSTDLNMNLYLDAFGRVPAGLFDGDSSWLGAYGRCNRQELLLNEGKSSTRYCLASIKMNDWPENKLLGELVVFKLAVCLPKACDSMKYNNKYQLIQQLIEFNARKFDVGLLNLSNLYCLPDEESSLRIWWYSPGAVVTVCLFTSWFLLLLYSTIKHQKSLKENNKRLKKDQDSEQSKFFVANGDYNFGLRNGFKVEPITSKQLTDLKFYESLSIIHNLESLFNISKASSIMDGSKEKTAIGDNSKQAASSTERPIVVDLQVIEGIKVICSAYIIMAHVMMCSPVMIKNGREMAAHFTISFMIVNLVPAFAVNAFFTITGLLTSYLLFKQNQSNPMLTSPSKWFGLTLYRYLRIMPMYLIVVLYSKYLAKYTGSGPLWDYGTSSLSQRKICEQESWLWTLLFGANFKPPLEHCIPSAWYLANDFQFALVTPIFLACFHKYPKFGQNLIKFCIAAGYIASFINIYTIDLPDLRPIARFLPYGFKTFITFMNESYTQPQYRIPAYLVGLLMGYSLHTFEKNKLKLLSYQQRHEQSHENIADARKTESELKNLVEQSNWPEWFRRNGSRCCIFFVTLCCLTPFIASHIPFSKQSARFLVALIIPSYHVLFSTSIGLYLLLATTGYGNKLVNQLLAAPVWKPLARLSLCVVLINIEVIMFIAQGSTQTQQLDYQYHASLNIYCILVTYFIATLTCVLFEAPLRAILNKFVASTILKLTISKKGKTN